MAGRTAREHAVDLETGAGGRSMRATHHAGCGRSARWRWSRRGRRETLQSGARSDRARTSPMRERHWKHPRLATGQPWRRWRHGPVTDRLHAGCGGIWEVIGNILKLRLCSVNCGRRHAPELWTMSLVKRSGVWQATLCLPSTCLGRGRLRDRLQSWRSVHTDSRRRSVT